MRREKGEGKKSGGEGYKFAAEAISDASVAVAPSWYEGDALG